MARKTTKTTKAKATKGPSAEDRLSGIVDSIIAGLEKVQSGEWRCPWQRALPSLPYNGSTKRQYRGVNVLTLWLSGYQDPEWWTYRQAAAAGGQVRKGEKATHIVFFRFVEVWRNGAGKEVRNPPDTTGLTFVKRYPSLTGFAVFNRAQIDGLPERPVATPLDESERLAEADAFISGQGAEFMEGTIAAYDKISDVIILPPFKAFHEARGYYSTTFHELGHWTGAHHRLDREFGKRFGDDAYAAEELVAELTSAFCCARFGFDHHTEHTQYIAHWIRLLKADANAVMTADSAAHKAYDYLIENEADQDDQDDQDAA